MSSNYYPSNGSPLFAAQWRGKCPECEERWEEADMIGYVEAHEKPVCEGCHTMLDTFVPYSSY